jgi:hypothetical protein
MSASLVADYLEIAREYDLDLTEFQGREAS